jgi:RNA polymerase sigma-70 factor, ECF subfamily
MVRCSPRHKAIGLAGWCDPEAFELIYRNYCGLVHRVCLRMLRDPAEAEDAAQDVFLRVFSKIHTFRGEAAFSSWLYRLTTNIVLMRFRKNKHNCASLCKSIDDKNVLRSEIGVPDLHLGGVLVRIALREAIDLLPEGYKAAVILHDVQGYDHKEIADIFGYSIGNSKSQLHKARKRLRQLLCESEGVRQNVGVVLNGQLRC